MKVLVIGSGGREHALAWKIAQSPRLTRLFVAPGNGGTGENVPIPVGDSDRLVAFAKEAQVDLTVVGPEAPLAEGLVDRFQAEGLRIFGPVRAAARLESSKAFAKAFMTRHGIPTARYAAFSEYYAALRHLLAVDYPVVIKASGLAAGKGVIVPTSLEEAEDALRQIMVERVFGAAGDEVVIEERLTGVEASLLAFCDGKTIVPMPPAQDHKRLLEGDRGPNTGGMGAFAPSPACPPALVAQIARTILQPAVDGLRAEGTPYVGVLYAGLMLTTDGPNVLEFNCRFGDPETQAILPLLDSDLLDILEACVEGRLSEVDVRWREGACACIVLASGGYPHRYEKGHPITGLDAAAALPGVALFHAGTRREATGQLLTDGGRVLGVTAVGDSLEQALARAYAAAAQIQFKDMHYRRDIGRTEDGGRRTVGAHGPVPLRRLLSSVYAEAGVDIAAGHRAVELMRAAVQSTYGPEVLAGIGAFGGLYDAAALKDMTAPVLVASTDGVGTKTRIARALGRFGTIGYDLVHHCVNDILVQGARPLFFLDYIASARLEPEVVAAIVSGVAAACRAVGMSLLGGETAEMPGVYAPGEFDLVGTILGVVERSQIVDGSTIQAGDVLLGLASSGPHTNGYSLIRKVFEGVPLDARFEGVGVLGEALLAPHRCYLEAVARLRSAVPIKGLAHITGGGLVDNPPRILPPGLGLVIRRGTWPIPPLFRLIQARGDISDDEMAHVFNLGIGLIAVLAAGDVPAAQAALDEPTWVIGEVVPGDGRVTLA
jgi:phosphoribosylamine--glycine ligase/phosphoribosylaminoimidazole synthetase